MPRSLPPTQTGILVIGDIARSPRMCYHTRSLLINNPNGEVHVYALGDDGGLPEHLLDQDASRRVHFHQVPHFQPPRTLPRFMYLTLAILRIVWQCVWLFWQMVVVGPRLEWLLVQVSRRPRAHTFQEPTSSSSFTIFKESTILTRAAHCAIGALYTWHEIID